VIRWKNERKKMEIVVSVEKYEDMDVDIGGSKFGVSSGMDRSISRDKWR